MLVDVLGGMMVDAVGLLATVIEAAVPYVTAFARAVGDLVKWLAEGVRDIVSFFGIDMKDREGTKPGSSVGAAAKSANIGDVQGDLRKAITSAFSLGTAASSPENRTAGAAEALVRKADEIYNQIRNLPGEIGREFEKALSLGGTREGRAQQRDDARDVVNSNKSLKPLGPLVDIILGGASPGVAGG